MKKEVLREFKNPFLDRLEITLRIESNGTPSREEVKSLVGKDPKLTVVKKIGKSFGKSAFTAEVFVYDSEESKEKIEVIPKKIRKKLEEEKKKAEEEKAKEKEQESNKKNKESPENKEE